MIFYYKTTVLLFEIKGYHLTSMKQQKALLAHTKQMTFLVQIPANAKNERKIVIRREKFHFFCIFEGSFLSLTASIFFSNKTIPGNKRPTTNIKRYGTLRLQFLRSPNLTFTT